MFARTNSCVSGNSLIPTDNSCNMTCGTLGSMICFTLTPKLISLSCVSREHLLKSHISSWQPNKVSDCRLVKFGNLLASAKTLQRDKLLSCCRCLSSVISPRLVPSVTRSLVRRVRLVSGCNQLALLLHETPSLQLYCLTAHKSWVTVSLQSLQKTHALFSPEK